MATSTNAPMILSIFGFYIIIILLFGFIGIGSAASHSFASPDEPGALTFLSQIGYFFSGIFFTLGNIPGWANTILFLPLGITLFYIMLSFFRGSS